MRLTVIRKTADILGVPAEPYVISKNDSQLLYGEEFFVEEERGAYVYGHSVIDGYKGSVERDQLVFDAIPPTHFVSVRSGHIYPKADFKSRPKTQLSFLSRVSALNETSHGFTKLEDGDWIFSNCIAPINNFKMAGDLAQTATMFLNAPYLYGGRSCFGIDCSGLVQQVLIAHGYPNPPRDACDQEGNIGESIKKESIARNDIIFFKGHVGIMIDEKNIINATARHMSTVIEKLDTVEEAYNGITHISRLNI